MKSDYELKRDNELKEWLHPKPKGLKTAFVVLFLMGGYIIGSAYLSLHYDWKLYEELPFFYKYLNVFIGCFYVLLSLFSFKFPYETILIAFVFFIGVIIYFATLEITTIYKGFLFKIIAIIALTKALKDGKEIKRYEKDILDQELV